MALKQAHGRKDPEGDTTTAPRPPFPRRMAETPWWLAQIRINRSKEQLTEAPKDPGRCPAPRREG